MASIYGFVQPVEVIRLSRDRLEACFSFSAQEAVHSSSVERERLRLQEAAIHPLLINRLLFISLYTVFPHIL
jgi:hypothetical protein